MKKSTLIEIAEAHFDSLSPDRAVQIGASIVSGSPLAAMYEADPMVFADQFIATMQEAVDENDGNNRTITKWRGARNVIEIYDEELTDDDGDVVRGGEFPHFSAAEQAYIIAELDAWLPTRAQRRRDEEGWDV